MAHRTQPESGSPITQLEQSALTAVDRALAPVVREASRNPASGVPTLRRDASVVNRIREANAPLIEAIEDATRQAVNMGVDDAVEEAPPPDTAIGQAQAAAAHFNPHADDSTLDRLTADIDVSREVRSLTSVAMTGVASGLQVVTTVVSDLQRAVGQFTRTKLIDSYSRGRRWYANLFGYELMWITVGDGRVCPVCTPLDKTVIASTKAFTSERADFQGVPGQPPAHPRCRCYTEVRRPS